MDLEPPDGLGALTVLTPGDFEVVRRKAQVMGELDDPGALTALLCAECEAKPNRPAAVGFGSTGDRDQRPPLAVQRNR